MRGVHVECVSAPACVGADQASTTPAPRLSLERRPVHAQCYGSRTVRPMVAYGPLSSHWANDGGLGRSPLHRHLRLRPGWARRPMPPGQGQHMTSASCSGVYLRGDRQPRPSAVPILPILSLRPKAGCWCRDEPRGSCKQKPLRSHRLHPRVESAAQPTHMSKILRSTAAAAGVGRQARTA